MRVVCDGCKRVLANKGSLKNHLKLVISNQKFRFSFETKQLKLFILFRNSIVVYCIELLCILSEILVTLFHFVTNLENQGFGSENQDFFWRIRIRIWIQAKNLHADPDSGGIRGRGMVVKGKNYFFFSFFHVSDVS